METDYLIIGAGVSGLIAARSLQEKGNSVQLVDKGRGVGGRVATRWLGSRDDIRGRWDHGAQFITLRSQRVREAIHSWAGEDLLQEWQPAYSDPAIIRYVCPEGMNQLPKALAKGLDLHRGQRIQLLEKTDTGWLAISESGNRYQAQKCLLTLPAPQLLDLLEASSIEVDANAVAQIGSIRYDRTLSLLAELESAPELDEGGYVHPNTGILETVIAHQQKGISASPTVTAHAQPEFSLEWYDRDRNTAATVMRAALQEYLDAKILNVQIHGWKFATPRLRVDAPYLDLADGLRAAGDGYTAGEPDAPASLHPRMEAAMLSGLQAGESF